MKVLMICTEKLPVPNIRGGAIQTYICGVMGMLAKNHTLTILGRSDPDLPDDESVGGIRYVRIRSDGNYDLYRDGVVEFIRSHREKFNIVHLFNRPRLVEPVHRELPSSRMILSMHNDMFHPYKIHRSEGEAAIDITERIITISDYIGSLICQEFPQAQGKTRTIYSGVDLQRFVPWTKSDAARRARERIRLEHGLTGKKVILFVGRLSAKKGPHVLIKAMSQLKHRDAALVVVGGSWYSDNSVSDYVAYVRALASHSPIPVITTGYIAADRIQDWFSAGDVFVCTSLWEEPLARVHYEAMASGLPFLTTARGGNPEVVIGNNGILIENAEDFGEYAQKLDRILSDLGRAREMGAFGRSLAEKRFSWGRVAEEILDVWEGGKT